VRSQYLSNFRRYNLNLRTVNVWLMDNTDFRSPLGEYVLAFFEDNTEIRGKITNAIPDLTRTQGLETDRAFFAQDGGWGIHLRYFVFLSNDAYFHG
jgi:hypothetical protein